VFYKLLGVVTWKAIKHFARKKVSKRRIAAGAVIGTVGLLAVGAALKGRQLDA